MLHCRAVHATEEAAIDVSIAAADATEQAARAAVNRTAHVTEWAAEKAHDNAGGFGRLLGTVAGKAVAAATGTASAVGHKVSCTWDGFAPWYGFLRPETRTTAPPQAPFTTLVLGSVVGAVIG